MGAGAGDEGRQDVGLSTLVAGLSGGAGLIHIAVVAEHTGGDAIVPIGFVLVGLAQLGLAVALLAGWRRTQVVAATAAVHLAALGVWTWSRTAGLPFDPYGGVAEPVASIDLTAAILEALAVTAVAGMLAAPSALRLPRAGALAAGVAALGVASMVVVAPDNQAASTTAAGSSASSGGGHAHGAAAAAPMTADGEHALEMIRLDRTRCDLGFNPQAYWDEAPAFGVDTYGGGTMEMPSPTGLADFGRPPLLDGRGSQHLDSMISLTSVASGEGAAARLILALAEANDEEYLAWRDWVALNISGSHTDSHAAPAPGQSPTTPTMGHPGPQAWQAMIDQAACEELTTELSLARDTAMRYPTVADATAAGWRRVTGYVPGIAAHYMNFGLVDDEFHIEEPEMLLFDGTSPESRIVGLSYYVQLEGSSEPTQGFIGENDHYHRHFGLCVGPTGVIGDSTTTEEECAARGGRKDEGTAGWMSHAWVVPGCESPWGVFSGENPILDRATGEASGQPGAEGCSASTARQRYDLTAGSSDLLVRGGGGDREEAAGS